MFIFLFFFLSNRLESTQSIIIPELVELTNDEETSVRLAGLETITNLLSLLDDGEEYIGCAISKFYFVRRLPCIPSLPLKVTF